MYRYTVHVPQHVPRIKMGAYVRRAFSLLPESQVRAAFAARDVKLNGVRVGKDDMVLPGGEVTVFTGYRMEIPVVFEDSHILALDKPAGVSCDADAYGSMTVQDWAAFYADGAFAPRMCHRLDNPTSGLIVLAKDEAAELALKQMFQQRTGKKEYCCLVRGMPKPGQKLCTAWLLKDAGHARVRIYDHEVPGAKRIETEYAVQRSGAVSKLKILPHTGRTHQIRAHMAFLGYPLLGDDLYGDREFNQEYGKGRLMLRSVALRIDTAGALPELDGITLRVPDDMD